MDDIVYTHATVFSAVDESVVTDGAVWVRDGLVAYAGPMQAMPEVPKEIQQVDASGQFIMPGMTETHAHLSFADASPFAIGDTSVEDATITRCWQCREDAGCGIYRGG